MCHQFEGVGSNYQCSSVCQEGDKISTSLGESKYSFKPSRRSLRWSIRTQLITDTKGKEEIKRGGVADRHTVEGKEKNRTNRTKRAKGKGESE